MPPLGRRFRLGAGALLLVGLAGVWWMGSPSYLELAIPVGPHKGSPFWSETELTQVRLADKPGTLYVRRQLGWAYTESHGWRTAAEALNYFDNWLRREGWEREEAKWGEPVRLESSILDRHYRRPGDTWHDGPHVEVALEPVYDGCFTVTLTTSQPSWLRYLSDSFDRY